MSVTITALEAENVKRIKAVEITPSTTGLTLVGGAGLSFVIGIAGSWPLLSAKPAQALRSL